MNHPVPRPSKRTLLSIIELGGYPDFKPLYRQVGYDVESAASFVRRITKPGQPSSAASTTLLPLVAFGKRTAVRPRRRDAGFARAWRDRWETAGFREWGNAP